VVRESSLIQRTKGGSGGDSDSSSNFVAVDRDFGAAEPKDGVPPLNWKYVGVRSEVRRDQRRFLWIW
jgi:hypothetical protein